MANQSLTISFSTNTGDDSIELSVDLDDAANIIANNKRTSSFLFGDTVYFRVFTNPISGVDVSCYASDGSVDSHGLKTVEISDTAVFDQPPLSAGGIIAENTSSLSIPVYDDFSSNGLPPGSSPCGSISVDDDDPTNLSASQAGPGAYTIGYTAQYHSFSITKSTIPTGFDVADEDGDIPSYPIVIVIVGVEE